MKKAAIIILAILVLVVGGTTTYISMIDWNKHKDKIAAQFSEVTGKKVVFEGPVSFSIFPSPYLSATNIKVYNQDGDVRDAPLATIKSLVAELSLMPLLGGNFEVKMMTLIEPQIFMTVAEDGKLNWQSSLSEEQKLSLENIEISLDSVLLEKAKLNYVNAKHDVDVTLENLNAEVIAPSLYGPYRIEGSYIKDNNPEGFAISLGQFSESFATSINLVFNHPTSETFIRFDGTFLLKNDAINGNLIIDSKSPTNFVNKSFKQIQLAPEYEFPLAISTQVDTNKTKVELSNIVVKYGTTAGAGNILIPLVENVDEEEEEERRKLEIGFDFTDLDLAPVVYALKSAVDHYRTDGVVYHPQLGFDFIADVKSINTTYNDQNIKDFVFSADYIDNNLEIRNLSASLPGESEFKTTGDIFSDDDELTYTLNPTYSTNDLQKLLAWLGYSVQQITPATYKRSSGSATLGGTLKTVSISSLEISFDKSLFKGNVGIITGERDNIYIEVEADNFNFDNYIKPLSKDDLQKSFAERMNYRFSQLGFLNDIDVRVVGKLGLGIYENIPFENTTFDIDTAMGLLSIRNLNIGTVANAAIELSGEVKGLGDRPKFENLKYSMSTKEFSSFLNKFEIQAPNINLKNLKNFNSKGIVSGSLEKMAMKMVSKLEYIDMIYSGQLQKQKGSWIFGGNLELRAPDFVQFANDLYFNYNPKAFSLGSFNLATQIVGSLGNFRATKMNTFIGSNNFKGDVQFDSSSGRNKIVTTLDINRFEMERFFYNENQNKDTQTFRGTEIENENFIAKPFLDKSKINYSFYKTFDINGAFNIASLTYKSKEFNQAVLKADLKDAILNISNFSGMYNGGSVAGNCELGITDVPYLRGDINLQKQKINEATFSGKKYGIKSGVLDSQITFYTSAVSEEAMLSGLNAEISFLIDNPVVKGWNLEAIGTDLKKRDKSEGLLAFVQENLQNGNTAFEKVSGNVKIVKAQYDFENTEFSSADWTVKMMNNGNVDNWDMDAAFEVVFLNSKVKPFSFSLSGPIISPLLSVDVKEITDTYDAYWAKVAADKKASEQAYKDKLKALMDEQQQYAQKTQNRLLKEVIPELEMRRNLTNDAEILAKYEVIDAKIADINKGLGEVMAQGLVIDFDESLPKKLADENYVLDEKSVNFKDEILGVYEQDVKKRINGFYNQIVESYNQSKTDASGYRDKFGDFPKRLAMIKTLFVIEQDNKIISLKKEIEDKLLALDAVNTQVVKDYIFVQNGHDLAQLEAYAGKISQLVTQSQEELNALNAKIEELFVYADEVTKKEEDAYEERLKQEEIKRKLEENTGKISGAKGNDITVTRNLAEIEKMEEAKAKEDIPVLDFSGKTPSGLIRKPTIILDESLKEEEAQNENSRIWIKPEAASKVTVDIKSNAVAETSAKQTIEPVVASEQKESKPLLKPETSLLRQPNGNVSKASGTIMRVDY